MGGLEIRFVSRNPHKLREAAEILARSSVHVVALNLSVDELQTEDTKKLVKDKALKAFAEVGRPLFVEHTGLYLRHLNQLPGGLTQVFWDRLEADRFAQLFGTTDDPSVIARTTIGYTDAKEFQFFEGEITGRITDTPRGSRDFQWDCVFQPDGHNETFAELGDRKNDISMRRRALDQFAEFLRERGHI